MLSARPSAPNIRKPYRPAICARLAMTMTSAATMPQPPIQPANGPKALVAQVNVVPQSGAMRLSSRYAYAMKNIGTNARTMMMGAWKPTRATTKPRVAARE